MGTGQQVSGTALEEYGSGGTEESWMETSAWSVACPTGSDKTFIKPC